MSESPFISHGFAPCDKPERYIQQLVKHWGHEYETSFQAGLGSFPFSDLESAVMNSLPDGIAITLSTAEQTRNQHMRGVIENHINRFAHREGPLNYDWKEQ